MIPTGLLPYAVTALVALGHALAWRDALGLSAWAWLGLGYTPALFWSAMLLRKDEALGELMRPVRGDLSIGILTAGVSVAVLYGIALLGFRFAPATCARDLQGILRVATSVSITTRGIGIFAFSVVEEVVWRGAVTHALEERMGSSRAPWVASGLFFLAVIPSLHPSLMIAGVILGVATAAVRVRFRRLTVAVIVHAFFTWITVEMILATLWQRVQAL